MDHFGPFLPKNFHERRLCQFSNSNIPIIYHQAKKNKTKKQSKKKTKKKNRKKTRLIPELTERQSDRQTDRQTDSQTDRQRAVTLYDSP